MAVTADQVQAAWDQIVAQGGRPTVRAIRSVIGGGSMGTLSRMLSQIRANTPQSASAAAGGQAVDALLQTITKSFTQREEQIRQELMAELADVRGDLEAALAESAAVVETARLADQKRSEAVKEAARAGGEASALRDQIATLDGRLRAAEERAESAAADAEAKLAAALVGQDEAQRLLADGLKQVADRYDETLEKMRGAWAAMTTEVSKAVAKTNVA